MKEGDYMENVLAVRAKKNSHLKLYTVCLILGSALLFAIGILCLSSDVTISVIVMLLSVVCVAAGIPGIRLNDKKIQKLNSYPYEAVVYKNGKLYIVLDTEIEVDVSTIKTVYAVEDTSNNGYFRITSSIGTLCVHTTENKYKIEQI